MVEFDPHQLVSYQILRKKKDNMSTEKTWQKNS